MEALKMETPMDSWNDDRLDELNGRMAKGFAHVDERFIRLEGEMREGFAKADEKMKEGFAEIKGELRQMNDKFDRRFECVDEKFNRLMHALMVAGLSFGITTFAALGGLFVTQI